MTDNLPDAIYFKDRESRFVRLSRSKVERSRQVLLKRFRATNPSFDTQTLPVYLTDTDKCGEYLIGKTDFDVYEEARARMSYTDEQEIINTGQPLIGKLEKTWQADGKSAWFLTSKLPWRDKTGNIVGTFGVSRDITALKEAEAKLEVVHQQLLETSRQAGMAEVATERPAQRRQRPQQRQRLCSLTIDRRQDPAIQGHQPEARGRAVARTSPPTSANSSRRIRRAKIARLPACSWPNILAGEQKTLLEGNRSAPQTTSSTSKRSSPCSRPTPRSPA